MMGFLDLPLEIIYLITGFLEFDSDISALSQTTRQLHVLLDPCLYKNNVKRYDSCALMWAVRRGRVSVAQKLLEAGAPLVHEETQPIFLAAIYGHDAVVKLFLERGLRPDGEEKWWLRGPGPGWNSWDKFTEDCDREPVFMDAEDGDPTNGAILSGNDSVVQLLHAYGGMAHWDQARVVKAMGWAIAQGHTAVVKFLHEEYPETINYILQTNKMLLCNARKTEIARILIQAGVPVDIADSGGCTPLGHAVRSGDKDLVRLLVEAGACLNPVLPNGVTLGYIRRALEAGRNPNLEVIQYLLTYVDVESKISAGGEDLVVLLLVAVACGFDEMLEKILMTGCHPDETCAPYEPCFPHESRTALSWAIHRGDIKITTLLLEQGADPNRLVRGNLHPLIQACRSGNTDLVALLLEHDADVDCEDWDGTPALVVAMPFPPILDMLLERGADCQGFSMATKLSPIEWAIESGNISSVQRLLNHGVPLEVSREAAKVRTIFDRAGEPPMTRTILTPAATAGASMLRFLHPYGVIPVPGDEEAQIAMRSAVRRGDSITTEYLLNQGFDPNHTALERGSWHDNGYDYDDRPRPYLGDAAEADDPEAAAATVEVLLRYGADIGKVELPPRCWPSLTVTEHCYTDRQLTSLRLLLEGGASPLPDDKFGLAMLAQAAEKNHKKAIELLLSYVDKRGLSLDDLHRNLLLVEELSTQWEKQRFEGSWYMVRLWRRLYWRKRYPVPT